MIIEYKNYLLVQDNGRFNLQKKVIRTKKDSVETYEDTIDVGYGYRLDSAIRSLILNHMEDKEEVVNLKQFLKEYMDLQNELLYKVNKA